MPDPFAPSHLPAPPGAERVGDVSPGEPAEVSVYLKPLDAPAPAPATGAADPRAALAAQRAELYAPAIDTVRRWAEQQGLTVTATDPARRLVKISGTLGALQKAFGAELGLYRKDGQTFRARTGALALPEALQGSVEAVLGLDARPAARPHFVRGPVFAPRDASVSGALPNAIGQVYGFPQNVTGAGQTIAIIELGGGYSDADNQAAFAAMNVPVPAITAVSVDGAANSPGGDADGEVALDIQVAGGNAPGAALAIYFTTNTTQGFVDAVSAAAHDTANAPHAISISWGAPEGSWSAQATTAMNSALADAATLGVSVFAAAGDALGTDGQNDGQAHVDFPASSPNCIGCGGTTLAADGSETVWNSGNAGTGGGISDLFPVPAFQSGVALPPSVNDGGTRRGVPDVCGNADPATGYQVVLDGQTQVVGGTSAVAPLWAALTVLLNQAAGKPLGFFLSTLYGQPSALNDVTSGNNQPAGTTLGYTAGPGWDACTGLGSPNGAALVQLFAPGQQTPVS